MLPVGSAEAPGPDVVDGEVLRGPALSAYPGQFCPQLPLVLGFEWRAHENTWLLNRIRGMAGDTEHESGQSMPGDASLP